MQAYKSTIKYFLLLICITVGSIFGAFVEYTLSALPVVYAAEGDGSRVVRIGYYEGEDSFQDGFSDDVRKSGYAYEYYQKIFALTGWDYKYVYGSREEIFDKLISGEVDIMAGVYKTDKDVEQVLFSKYDMGLEDENRYFVVNKERNDLLEDLNYALLRISTESPDFITMLRQKYYNQDTQIQILTAQEKEWLTEKGSLKFGYIKKNLPLSDQTEEGVPTGVAGEIITMISEYLKIPLQPVCYDNVAHMEEGLKKGEIDAAFPIYSDLWINEAKGFFQTDAFISDRVIIVYQGNYRDDLLDKIGVSETGLVQNSYLSDYYPESEVVYYDTKEDAFNALREGEVNCMIGCASIIQRFLAVHNEYEGFNIAYLDIAENFGIAVNKGESRLVLILNKAVSQLDDATITNDMIQYSNVEMDADFLYFIRKYAVAVIFILSVFFAMLLWAYINYRHRTKRFNERQAETCAALEDALGAANAASIAKTTFLSNMSHDIRTPMNGIIGMTAIAEANIDDKPRVKDCLEKITASSKHLLALINEVLDMSKIESGAIQLNEEVFELSELMDELIIMNRMQAESKHHELLVHIMNVKHEKVIGDDLRLQQIYTNLVGNAIKYTPDGGKIKITLSEKPSGNPKLGCFEFVVKDNGIGMSEDYLPQIFEAFTREESNAAAARAQGTGLGMAIARNMARMMDGDITVESKLGEGSTFTVTVFLKLIDTEHIPYENFAGLKVLLIDDDPVICESTVMMLSELGIEAEYAMSGMEAIEHIKGRQKDEEDYFAILIDWQIPGMDAVTTIREIRKLISKEVPIIIISTYDWSSIEAEAVDAGATCFINKPLFRSRLVHLFESLLGNNEEEKGTGLKELTAHVNFNGKRALLAEDNELNAEIAIEILGMVGLTVDWAVNGKEAVKKMEASASGYYDCIFMDIQMPIMNGIDAAKEIRALQHPDAERIPIFAMTANAFAEDVRAVLDAGMNEHIAKPLDFDMLIKVLSDYLG